MICSTCGKTSGMSVTISELVRGSTSMSPVLVSTVQMMRATEILWFLEAQGLLPPPPPPPPPAI